MNESETRIGSRHATRLGFQKDRISDGEGWMAMTRLAI
jgi:hypothetical protein